MTAMTFEEFWMAREQAAEAYVRGDGGKLNALVPHEGSANFHSPRGDTVVGAQDVALRYLADAKTFHNPPRGDPAGSRRRSRFMDGVPYCESADRRRAASSRDAHPRD